MAAPTKTPAPVAPVTPAPVTPVPVAPAAPAKPAAKTTITCVKGTVRKNVTAVKPTCPTGYVKK